MRTYSHVTNLSLCSVRRMVACTHSPGSAHKLAPDWWCFALFQNQLSTQNTKNYRLYKHGKILCVFFVDCVSTSSVRTTSAVNRPPVSVCHERVGSDKNNMQISWAFVSAHATGWKARRRVTPPEDDASPPLAGTSISPPPRLVVCGSYAYVDVVQESQLTRCQLVIGGDVLVYPLCAYVRSCVLTLFLNCVRFFLAYSVSIKKYVNFRVLLMRLICFWKMSCDQDLST